MESVFSFLVYIVAMASLAVILMVLWIIMLGMKMKKISRKIDDLSGALDEFTGLESDIVKKIEDR